MKNELDVKLHRFGIAAVVVTYNRRNLLQECLQALLSQTRPPDEIIVIDNASTDGTDQMFPQEFPQVTYVRLKENIGGAGGFHEGMKLAYEKGHDWIWVMDDDAIPMHDALQSLISAYHTLSVEKARDSIGILCSHVEWIDGSPHIMNIPQVRALVKSMNGNIYPFNEFINKGFIRVASCSFVSVLVSRYALKVMGLPIKEMFIYGDDVEFTERICRQFPCYYVPNSRVIHKTKSNSSVDILTAPSDRLWYYFFDIRNKTFMSRRRGMVLLIAYITMQWTKDLKNALRRHGNRLEALKVCLMGLISGLLFRPKVRKP